MTQEEFEKIIWDAVSECPHEWRRGQSVFNMIDEIFGVARMVQFEDGIDCFYNDDSIESFIAAAWVRYKNFLNNKETRNE